MKCQGTTKVTQINSPGSMELHPSILHIPADKLLRYVWLTMPFIEACLMWLKKGELDIDQMSDCRQTKYII